MQTREKRYEQVLEALAAGDGWITGADMGARIGVRARSVRDYVRELNARAGVDLIESGQDGYRLRHGEYRRYRESQAVARRPTDTREQRLYAIVRRMVAQSSGVDVFELADELHVSASTIESDLGRARELVREYRLSIHRDRDRLHLVGAERQKRRLVRFLLFIPGAGGITQSLANLGEVLDRTSLRRLHTLARPVLVEAGIEVNEYALNDILVHLSIAARRVELGEPLNDSAVDLSADPLSVAVNGLADAVEETTGIRLPDSELSALHSLLLTHSTALEPDQREQLRAELPLDAVRAALRDVSAQFGLDMYDDATVTRLALHVKNLITRVQSERTLTTPLGMSFRATHPFIHELALLVARHIESDAGVEIDDGEIDFLAFHLGTQVQRQLHQGPPITLTVVVPHYASLHDDLVARLSAALGDQAIVQEVVTSLVDDWSRLTTDLVVSVVDLPADSPVPVIRVSPFLTADDIATISAKVQRERLRARQDKLRAIVVSLFDPALFRRASSVASKDEAIRILSDALAAEGYVAAGFEHDVLDRERRAPTAFGGQFAIPHSLYMDAMKTGIAVLVLDDGIAWGPSRAVRLALMFAVSPDGRAAFRDVLDEVTGVLSEPANIASLVDGATDHHGFMRAFSALLTS